MRTFIFMLLSSVCLILSGCRVAIDLGAEHPLGHEKTLHELSRASGLLELEKKNSLQFTFNVQLPDKAIARNWLWDIAGEKVYLNGEEVGLNDKRFVNDKYWLLFPLMAYYDKDQVQISIKDNSQSPIDKQPTTEMTVTYTGTEGYTPKDVYKLYYNSQMRIVEWAYYKSGKEPPARTTKWIAYREYDGISLSLERPSAGEFKVWFTDVVIQ